ncbi:hypothetical protein AmaxDRAFT_2568 [Limnospira maxima CS-328]|uniref:Uncharacterized protein n=2 Tax=Limnospira TaxID=2596745 RepID=A0A9P1KEM1_9CYAN|nr:hypothetical protein AmaxDRAFT_2568 [Limnospira maxima CS-328]UWU49335.1 hypothetical protein APLC1_4183 [Arthrospira platensis C1]CDM94611.1 conserved protein of unknown function [Limnospira indica PCC 8005]
MWLQKRSFDGEIQRLPLWLLASLLVGRYEIRASPITTTG